MNAVRKVSLSWTGNELECEALIRGAGSPELSGLRPSRNCHTTRVHWRNDILYDPPPANDNRDLRDSPTGAYFFLLRLRADLLREAPDPMTADYRARLGGALAQLDALMRKVRPYL